MLAGVETPFVFPRVGMVINLIVLVYVPIIRIPYERWDEFIPKYKEFDQHWHILDAPFTNSWNLEGKA